MSPLNVERIIAVKDTAYAVAKRELEKIWAFLDSNPDNWDTSAVLLLIFLFVEVQPVAKVLETLYRILA